MRLEHAMLYVAQWMAQGEHWQMAVAVIIEPGLFHVTSE